MEGQSISRLAARLTGTITGEVVPCVDAVSLAEAMRWLHDAYVGSGLIGRSALRMRARAWEHDPGMATWAWRDDEYAIRGVLSLIRDGPLALPCDHVVPEAVAALRQCGPVGCASNLAVDACLPHRAKLRVILGLVCAAYARALELGIAHVVAAVSPGHADMLGSICGFAPIGEPCVYPGTPEFTGSGPHDGPPDVVQVIVMDIAAEAERMRLLAEAVQGDTR